MVWLYTILGFTSIYGWIQNQWTTTIILYLFYAQNNYVDWPFYIFMRTAKLTVQFKQIYCLALSSPISPSVLYSYSLFFFFNSNYSNIDYIIFFYFLFFHLFNMSHTPYQRVEAVATSLFASNPCLHFDHINEGNYISLVYGYCMFCNASIIL